MQALIHSPRCTCIQTPACKLVVSNCVGVGVGVVIAATVVGVVVVVVVVVVCLLYRRGRSRWIAVRSGSREVS